MSSPPAGEGDPPRWLPPAEGSDWRVTPGAPPEARYGDFASPRSGMPRPISAPPPARPAGREDPSLPVNGKAIAALVLAVCGVVVLPFVSSLVAIVLGSLARSEIARDGRTRGARLADLGILAGAAAIAIWAVILVVVAANAAGGG